MYFEKVSSKKAKSGFTWKVCISYTDENGYKQIHKKGGFTTKAQAQEYGVEMESMLKNNGGVLFKSTKSFNDVFLEYMEVEGKYKYANSTKEYYMMTFENHIKSSIGNNLITSLHYVQIQKYFNKLESQSLETNKNIKKVFNVTLKHALKSGYIKENPMSMIDVRGKDTSKEQHVISLSDLHRLTSSILSTDHGRKVSFQMYSACVFLYLGYFLGTRRSEAYALRKEDVNFKTMLISINKRLEYHGLNKDELHSTERLKTKDSKSEQPLPNQLRQILIKWFDYNPFELVCCDENGNYLDPKVINRLIKRHSKKLGIEFRTHDLRRSYVTNLVKGQVDVKTVSELARHSNVRTTLEVYTLISSEDKEKAINSVFNTDDFRKTPKNLPNPENIVIH